ncbi:hypothetical protein TeGR_g8505 [Tetraparma gracilis]|uniref:Centriolar satellite-associated tubulin polyglutamylase complex regulator 1 n=1 Tax=Tetraparma gracilis TaxID=2962635 RepID=A0ABQ6MUI9_9STRA|nr:hypothetical protein TeGR_g8505 [Tetraparma gracilis]
MSSPASSSPPPYRSSKPKSAPSTPLSHPIHASPHAATASSPHQQHHQKPAPSLSSLPSSSYLSHAQILPYLNDSISTLLSLAPSGHPLPLTFLANYFEHLLDPAFNHTAGKNFAFVSSTLFNRSTFLHFFLKSTASLKASGSGGGAGSDAVTPDDFHQLTLFLCPDFMRPVIHTAAWLQNGGKPLASTSPLPFSSLSRAFVVYYYHLEFFLLLLSFFSAAYDGASSTPSGAGDKRSIVMPPLACDADESPVREIAAVYGGGGGGGKGDGGPSWRRAFGCSVDVSHVAVALKRIEKGCRDCGRPYIPSAVWGAVVGAEGEGGGGGGGEGGAGEGVVPGTKLTLERLWSYITRDASFNVLLDRVAAGDTAVRS